MFSQITNFSLWPSGHLPLLRNSSRSFRTSTFRPSYDEEQVNLQKSLGLLWNE
jgi:hypothetical protein